MLAPGESVVVEDYEIQYLGTAAEPKGNRTEFVSSIEVSRGGELMETFHPKRSFYPSFNMAATRAAIRSTPVEDLYLVPSENLPNGSVGLRILVNPLIWWMWVAGPVLVLGTLISLWPQSVPVPAGLRTPGLVPGGARASGA